MHGFRNARKLKAVRREAKAASLNPPAQIDGPKPRRMRPCEHMPGLGYAIPFPGAPTACCGVPWCAVVCTLPCQGLRNKLMDTVELNQSEDVLHVLNVISTVCVHGQHACRS